MKKINAFLSHNSDDKPAVERIALRLKDEKDMNLILGNHGSWFGIKYLKIKYS